MGKRIVWVGAVYVAAAAVWMGACGQSSSPDGGVDAAADQDATAMDADGRDVTADSAVDATADAADASDLCTQMCDHVTACTGFSLCTQAGIDCATTSISACVESCVINTTCQQLGYQTLQGCQATCAAEAGTDAATDAAPEASAQGCQQCVQSSCTTQALSCGTDAVCKQWLTCISSCPSAACFAQCDAQYPSAQSLYAPVYGCACAQCSGPCATIDPCAYGTDGGP